MDRHYIRDNEVIERYLSGVLTPDEEQAFEEAYLGDPEMLDQIEAAQRLRDGIKGLGAAGRLERLRPPAPWRRMLTSPRYAAAASVLLAVSAVLSGALYLENRGLRQTDFPSASTVTRLMPLASTRGDNGSTIPEPAEDEWIVFQLDAGVTEYDSYRAALERRDGSASAVIWSHAGLTPVRGEIAVGSVAGSALRPGEYEVRLEGRMDEPPAERFEEVSRTRFTIVPRN
jgi:hypothetical protein